MLTIKQESALMMIRGDALDLLHALDNGYLAYKADSPESAFIGNLRTSLEFEKRANEDARDEARKVA